MSGTVSFEGEGDTIEEAVSAALASLGLRQDEVDVEVLAQPSRGLFGLGGRRARVRVSRRHAGQTGPLVDGGESAPPPAPAPAEDRAAVAAHARDVLAEVLRRMGCDSAVEIEPEAEAGNVLLQIRGDHTSVLIGKHGQTLDALEYLVNRVVSREEETTTRVALDCEDYRVRRRRSLEELAAKMAEQARKRGRPVTLNPMSPRDRRTVHLALQGDPSLTTRSSGEGFYRRLVITPERGRRRQG